MISRFQNEPVHDHYADPGYISIVFLNHNPGILVARSAKVAAAAEFMRAGSTENLYLRGMQVRFHRRSSPHKR